MKRPWNFTRDGNRPDKDRPVSSAAEWEMTRAGRSGKAEIESQVTHYVVEVPPQAKTAEEWERELIGTNE